LITIDQFNKGITMDEDDFRNIMRLLSSKAFNKRAIAVKKLHRLLLKGCWRSRLMLEYVLEHDPNSAIRNRVILVFQRSSIEPREGHWEKHICL
jgi:hypothetical protein